MQRYLKQWLIPLNARVKQMVIPVSFSQQPQIHPVSPSFVFPDCRQLECEIFRAALSFQTFCVRKCDFPKENWFPSGDGKSRCSLEARPADQQRGFCRQIDFEVLEAPRNQASLLSGKIFRPSSTSAPSNTVHRGMHTNDSFTSASFSSLAHSVRQKASFRSTAVRYQARKRKSGEPSRGS